MSVLWTQNKKKVLIVITLIYLFFSHSVNGWTTYFLSESQFLYATSLSKVSILQDCSVHFCYFLLPTLWETVKCSFALTGKISDSHKYHHILLTGWNCRLLHEPLNVISRTSQASSPSYNCNLPVKMKSPSRKACS